MIPTPCSGGAPIRLTYRSVRLLAIYFVLLGIVKGYPVQFRNWRIQIRCAYPRSWHELGGAHAAGGLAWVGKGRRYPDRAESGAAVGRHHRKFDGPFPPVANGAAV